MNNGNAAVAPAPADGSGNAAASGSRGAASSHVEPGSIPKPKGSAGGGKKGFNLQKEMGLATEEGDMQYTMILVSTRSIFSLVLEGPVLGPPKTGPWTRTGPTRTAVWSGPIVVQSWSWSWSYAAA